MSRPIAGDIVRLNGDWHATTLNGSQQRNAGSLDKDSLVLYIREVLSRHPNSYRMTTYQIVIAPALGVVFIPGVDVDSLGRVL